MKKCGWFLKIGVLFLVLFAAAKGAAAQTAKSVSEKSAEKSTALESIEYIKTQCAAMKNFAEKRSLLAFLGAVQEQLGLYSDACASYSQAAAIAANDAEGMPKWTNEELILFAVRSALSAGDYESADNYLATSVKDSKNEDVIAYVKLYKQWSLLCRAQSVEDTIEPVAILQAYTSLASMLDVRPAIYLTLWYVTGKESWGTKLKTEFPLSPEAYIAKGNIQLLPAPFWYFVPKNGVQMITAEGTMIKTIPVDETASATAEKQSASEKKPVGEKQPVAAVAEIKDYTIKEQLGLFREEKNAKALVETLAKKGFVAHIMSETKPSGNTYFIVYVGDDDSYTIGKKLKAAGFDCYPIK